MPKFHCVFVKIAININKIVIHWENWNLGPRDFHCGVACGTMSDSTCSSFKFKHNAKTCFLNLNSYETGGQLNNLVPCIVGGTINKPSWPVCSDFCFDIHFSSYYGNHSAKKRATEVHFDSLQSRYDRKSCRWHFIFSSLIPDGSYNWIIGLFS